MSESPPPSDIDGASSELTELLDLQVNESGPTRVRGSIAADQRHHQPWGLVQRGLYTAAIETFATLGAYEAVKGRGQQPVGISNVTDFLRPHVRGRLNVIATAITRAGASSSGRSRSDVLMTTSSSQGDRFASRTLTPRPAPNQAKRSSTTSQRVRLRAL